MEDCQEMEKKIEAGALLTPDVFIRFEQVLVDENPA